MVGPQVWNRHIHNSLANTRYNHTYRCINIGWALIVGVGQHGNDTDEDGLHRVNRQPTLFGLLVSPLVLSRIMKNGYAHIAILFNWVWSDNCVLMIMGGGRCGLTIGVPYLRDELHLWRSLWVLLGEYQVSLEITPFAESSYG